MKKILLVMTLLLASTASACKVAPDSDRMQTIEQNVKNKKYETIMLGTVVSVTGAPDHTGDWYYGINIAQTYRGTVYGTIPIGSGSDSCGSRYSVGQVMVWFLDDINTVNESNPQYAFESLLAAQTAMEQVPGIAINAPVDCRTWNDGCNVCQRDSIGGPLACTERACFTHNTARCELFFDDNSGQPMGPHWGVEKGQIISSPFTLRGVTDPQGMWPAFEGQVGVVTLYDSKGKVLDQKLMTTVGDWMHASPHSFITTLVFDTTDDSGTIVLENHSIQDGSLLDSITIPVGLSYPADPHIPLPTGGPLDDFVGPDSQPPYDNSQPVDATNPQISWLQSLWSWIKGLFTW